MASDLGTRILVDYTSDDGTDYCVRMRSACATAGGFSASTSKQPDYPRSWRMRHVWGVAVGGIRKKLYIKGADGTLFVEGGTFTVGANTYTVYGRIGETRHS